MQVEAARGATRAATHTLASLRRFLHTPHQASPATASSAAGAVADEGDRGAEADVKVDDAIARARSALERAREDAAHRSRGVGTREDAAHRSRGVGSASARDPATQQSSRTGVAARSSASRAATIIGHGSARARAGPAVQRVLSTQAPRRGGAWSSGDGARAPDTRPTGGQRDRGARLTGTTAKDTRQ
jgi:hypothetical protein